MWWTRGKKKLAFFQHKILLPLLPKSSDFTPPHKRTVCKSTAHTQKSGNKHKKKKDQSFPQDWPMPCGVTSSITCHFQVQFSPPGRNYREYQVRVSSDMSFTMATITSFKLHTDPMSCWASSTENAFFFKMIELQMNVKLLFSTTKTC